MAQAQESQQLKDLKKFSENLRRTRLGVDFTKRLFTDPSSIDPKQITNIMRALGYDVPKEIQMTADAAQVITSGQAIVTGIQQYQTANDVGQATNTTAAGVATITAIAERNNAINSDNASLVRIGTSVAMIVCSYGTNVQAWAALAMELVSVNAKKQGLADYRATVDSIAKYKDRLSPQMNALAEIQLSLAKGDISSFGVIAKLAVEAPDLWPQLVGPDTQLGQLFPDLLALPVVTSHVTGHGESTIWGKNPFGGRYVIKEWSSSRNFDFMTLGKNFTKEIAADFLFNLYIVPWVNVYAAVNDEIVRAGNMSIENVAALSFLCYGGNAEISATENYVNLLIGTHLTPYDFDDTILEDIASQYIEESYAKVDKTYHEQAISFSTSPLNNGFNRYNKDIQSAALKLEHLRQTDDITELVKYQYVYKKLQAYMDFQPTSFELGKTKNAQNFVKVFIEGNNVADLRSWRKINNYIATLKVLDTFRKDSYLRNTKYVEQLLPFMPSVDSFEQKTKRLNEISMARNINALALSNIAQFVGTTSDKLVKVNTGEVGAAKYTKKG